MSRSVEDCLVPVLPRQEPELDPMEVVEEFGQQMYNLIPPFSNDEYDAPLNPGGQQE
ncbi:hypothetical protein AZE42_13201, partial [Rhizopogon vesiculosus]